MIELPLGWTETTLGEIASQGQYGWTSKATDNGQVKYLRTTDITSGQIDWGTVPFCQDNPPDVDKYKIELGDILISRAGSVGFSALIEDIPSTPAVFASYLIRYIPKSEVNSKYLAHFLKSPDYWQQISDAAAGIALANVNAKKLANLVLPLAPLNEQKRIAEKLDSLLARVDSCQSHLERVPQIIKRFRQSVLAAAFSGELSEQVLADNSVVTLLHSIRVQNEQKWEERHGLSRKYPEPETPVIGGLPELPVGWEWASPAQLSSGNQYALAIGPFGSNLMVKDYTNSGVPLIFVRNIRSGVFNSKNTVYISNEKAEELKAHKVSPGDIVITKMGEPPGDASQYPYGLPDAVATADCLKWSLSPLLPRKQFFVHAIHSPVVKDQIAQITKGVAQQKMSLARFKTLAIPVPPIEEQIEITHRIEKLFAYADRLEARYLSASKQIERLTPSLLARAFRGELVSQDAGDESAEILLERILSAKVSPSTKAKRLTKSQIVREPKMQMSLEEIIQELPTDTFSFDDLRETFSGDYEALKNELFRLLSDESPIIHQVFDQSAKTMRFVRRNK